MLVYVLSFAAFAVALGGLGIGILMGREGIRGTCGGLNDPNGCGACGRKAGAAGECPRSRAP